MTPCPGCGTPNPEGARFCNGCGAPVAAVARESRRLVTVLFSDLVDSTALGEQLDPEALRGLLDRYFEAMREVLVRHGGLLEKYIGDAIVAVFGLPIQREDDALRAVRAALEMRQTLTGLGDELRAGFGTSLQARIGIETGDVLGGAVTPGQRLVTGDTVNVAARLQGLAGPDEIVVGPGTAALVRSAMALDALEPARLKGKSGTLRPWRVVGPAAGPSGSRGEFVGRERELDLVLGAFEAVRSERLPHLILLLADAGMGKTRLAEEAMARMATDARILRGRCLSYGAGITFWPVAEIVREAARIDDRMPPDEMRARLEATVAHAPDHDRLAGRLASLLGIGGEVGLISELTLAFRVLLEGIVAEQPVVVLVEDLHWAERGLLDLLGETAEVASGPALLLTTARRVFREDQPDWPALPARSRTLTLAPLASADARRVLADALGADLPEQLADRLDVAGEGNPLFLHQLVASLVDDGGLVRDGDRWRLTAPLDELQIPTSIRALLGARLERLEPRDRGIVEGASVAGVVFAVGAVSELAPEPVRPLVPARLDDLGRRDLVRPVHEGFLGDDAYRFGHALIRDAAYAGTTKASRADLHLRFADWLTATAGERLVEYEEIVGHHLAEAWRYRSELRPGEDHDRIAERAVHHLARAGRRAFDRGDMPGAIVLLGRASGLRPPGHPQRLALVPVLGKAYLEAVRNDELAAYLAVVEQEAEATGDELALAHARILGGYLRVWSGVEADPDAAQQAALAARTVFEHAGDQRGLTRSELLLAEVAWMQARIRDSCGHWARAAELALGSGDSWEISETHALTAGLAWGTGATVDEALESSSAILEEADGNPMIMVRCLREHAEYAHVRGGPGAARVVAARAAAIVARLRMPIWQAELDHVIAGIELDAGDPAAAERVLAPYLEDAGSDTAYWFRSVAAQGADALSAQGRLSEARGLLDRAALFVGPDRHVRVSNAVHIVRTLIRLGDPSARGVAQALLDEAEIGAMSLAEDARMAMAEACLADGDAAEAMRWASEAEVMCLARGMHARGVAARAILEQAQALDAR